MASSRAPFVAVRTDVRKEERVRFIADHAGYNEHEALGRLVSLWCWCTDRGLDDAPDDCEGYAVPDAVVRRFLGPLGVEAILGDACDELAMGERRSIDGLIYLRGTADTVDRLRSLRTSSAAGGRAQAANGKRGAKGRFVASTTDVQPCGTSRPPASTSEIPDPRSQIPDPEEPDSRSRARAPVVLAGDTADAARLARRAGAGQIWRELGEARMRIAAELRLEARPLPAIGDPGELALIQRMAEPGADPDRVMADARHVIAVAASEATREDVRSVQWLTGSLFENRSWRRALGMTVADAKRARPAKPGEPERKPPRRADPKADAPPPLLSADALAGAREVLAEANAKLWGKT